METFKFIKGKYTNEKVVADSGVIKAVLSNGTDVTDSVNDETFQTAALDSDNISGKEVKVYTLRESLSNINPTGEVIEDNVKISSLGVTKSPSGVALPKAAATELSKTPATATLPNEINWNNSSGDNTTNVNVGVGNATIRKIAKFTISGTVTVKKFVKASGIMSDKPVYTKSNITTSGTISNNYYKDGRKCVAIEKYTTKEKEKKTPENLGDGLLYYNLVVSSKVGWLLGINRNGSIGETSSDRGLLNEFNINNASFGTQEEHVRVSAWKKINGTSYTKMSEVRVVCDPNVYYQGYRLPSGNCFDKDGEKLDSNSNFDNIDTVYKEKCDVVSDGKPYKYDSKDTNTYYTYASEELVPSSSENCNISNNALTPNKQLFTKEGDKNSIYLNEKVDNIQKKVEFQ